MKRSWTVIGNAFALVAGAAVVYPASAQAPQKNDQPKVQAGQKAQAAQKVETQKKAQNSQKAPAPKKAAAGPKKRTVAKARGKLEKLTCIRGTEDEQARIAVEVIGGRVQSFAYYSKKKPQTCSVHVQRDDAYSRWSDEGRFSKVTTENGDFLIENRPRDVKFLFRDVDRMHYCGMEVGKINGTLTVTRGKRECSVERLMDAHQREDTALEVAPQDKAERKQPPRS
jgi:hypothetical protein